MKLDPSSIVSLALVAHSVAALNITLSEQRALYCPFNVDVSLGPETDSIEINYSGSSTTNNLNFAAAANTCYVQMNFRLPEFANVTPSVMEVEYSGKSQITEGGKVDTQIAWPRQNGPTNFKPMLLSNSEPTLVKNTTSALGLFCYANYGLLGAMLHVRSTFDPTAIKFVKEGSFTQRLKVVDRGGCAAASPPCEYRDIDGNGPWGLGC